MADLHTTLVAKVTEHLELARAATPGPWDIDNPNEGTHHGPFWMVTNDAFHNPPADEDAPWIAVELHTGVRADAEHIAANDPQHVIRVCHADLERLERHTPVRRGEGFEDGLGCTGCGGIDVDWRYLWPCPEVRAIAAVYGVEIDQ